MKILLVVLIFLVLGQPSLSQDGTYVLTEALRKIEDEGMKECASSFDTKSRNKCFGALEMARAMIVMAHERRSLNNGGVDRQPSNLPAK